MRNAIILLLALYSQFSFSQITFQKKLSLLGSPFEITVVAKDSVEAEEFVLQAILEVKKIEQQISEWKPGSDFSKINQNAGIKPIKVPLEVYELIERSQKISQLTDGAFDISFASIDKIWKFDGSMKVKPSPESIRKSVQYIGYKNIILNKNDTTVYLSKKGMKIGSGGIGQGYIADKIKSLLQKKGCQAGIVNVSGDINTWGLQLNEEPWSVAIVNPKNKNKVFAIFPLYDSAVETSGTYEKFVEFDGIRYAHIIDPRTGYPSQGIISVSVFAKQTEIADALATSVMVLGVEVGLDLINQLTGIECVIVDDSGNIFYSDHINLEYLKNE